MGVAGWVYVSRAVATESARSGLEWPVFLEERPLRSRCRRGWVATPVLGAVLVVLCSIGAAAAEPTRAVVVGLDGLDFDFIRNRSNLEFMPNLGQIARDPSTRVLALKPTRPVLSPILWTSMVTGASPTRHDILDFFSYRDGRSLPISTVDRRMPAIWNVLSSRGISSLCLGTFISYPAEVIDGTYISDEAFTQRVLDRTSIHPERRVSSLGPRIGELLVELVLRNRSNLHHFFGPLLVC